MTEDKVQIFKLELKAMPLINKRIERLRLKLEQIDYELQNVRGVDPSKDVHISGVDNRLTMYEAKDKLQAQIDLLGMQKANTQNKLDQFSPTMQNILISIYCEGKATADIAEGLGYSESSLRRAINRQIAKTLYF